MPLPWQLNSWCWFVHTIVFNQLSEKPYSTNIPFHHMYHHFPAVCEDWYCCSQFDFITPVSPLESSRVPMHTDINLCAVCHFCEMAIEDVGPSPSLSDPTLFPFCPTFLSYLFFLKSLYPCISCLPCPKPYFSGFLYLPTFRSMYGIWKNATGPGIGMVALAPSRRVPTNINLCMVLLPRHLAKRSCVLFFRTPGHIAKSTSTTWK